MVSLQKSWSGVPSRLESVLDRLFAGAFAGSTYRVYCPAVVYVYAGEASYCPPVDNASVAGTIPRMTATLRGDYDDWML